MRAGRWYCFFRLYGGEFVDYDKVEAPSDDDVSELQVGRGPKNGELMDAAERYVQGLLDDNPLRHLSA